MVTDIISCFKHREYALARATPVSSDRFVNALDMLVYQLLSLETEISSSKSTTFLSVMRFRVSSFPTPSLGAYHVVPDSGLYSPGELEEVEIR